MLPVRGRSCSGQGGLDSVTLASATVSDSEACFMIKRPVFVPVVSVLFAGFVMAEDGVPEAPPAIDFKAQLPRIAPTEPGDTIAKFSIRPGFRIELVAAEPLLRDPVAVDFDEHGRMYVVEFPEYNQKHVHSRIPDMGRVRLLTDTDQDGVYDRSEVYADRLPYPTAVLCYDGVLQRYGR